MNSNKLPKNHNKRWSNNENSKLMSETFNKIPLEIIACKHNRTINAIKLRIIKNLIDEVNNIRHYEIYGDNNFNYSKNYEPAITYLKTISNLSKIEILEGFKYFNFLYSGDCNEIQETETDYYIDKYLC